MTYMQLCRAGDHLAPFVDGACLRCGAERKPVAAYAWLVDRDYTDDEAGVPVTVTGPRDADTEAIVRLLAGKGEPFRLYDDDGILYYSGRFIGDLAEGEDAFGPLFDYGMPNAGATEIRYANERGHWVAL